MVFSNNDEGLINKKLPKELLLSYSPVLMGNLGTLRSGAVKGSFLLGIIEWASLPAGWFQHSMDSFKAWYLHLLLSVIPYIYSKTAEQISSSQQFTSMYMFVSPLSSLETPLQEDSWNLRIFSFLDIVTLCRCAQISKAWNILALDGSNWQRIDLFNFQTDVEGRVVENISKRCGGFLRKLSLRGCIGVGDSSLKTFAQNCRNIEHLNLNGCTKITDSTCYSLSRFCSKLKHLDLTSCVSITNSSLKGISEGCRNLEYLNLSWCDQITKDGIESLVRGCRGLKALLLRGCTQLEDEALKHIQNYCHELMSLNLQSCSRITDEGVVQICRGCHRLQALCLSGCSNLTDASLTALALNCPRLQILEAARCSHLTDAGFTLLARSCHGLEKMDLEECALITDSTLIQLSIHCPNLQALSLSHCELITDDGILHLSNSTCGHERLRVLELDNCLLITDVALEHLENCRGLERLELYDCQQVTRAGIKRMRAQLPHVKVHAYFAPVTPPTAVGGSGHRLCRCCVIL